MEERTQAQEVLHRVCAVLGADPVPRLPRVRLSDVDAWVYPSPIVYLVELNTILVKKGATVTTGMLAHELGHYVLDILAAHVTLTPQVHEIVAGYAEHAIVKAGLDVPLDLKALVTRNGGLDDTRNPLCMS